MSEPRHALFPARVDLPDGTSHHPCRLATDTGGTTRAWAWIDGAPVQVGQWPAEQLNRADGQIHGRPQAFTIRDGTMIEGRNQGCGCNHPLKAWRPALVAPQG